MPSLSPSSTDLDQRAVRFSIRTLFLAVTILGIFFGFIGWQFQKAKREQRAYTKLCALGANGDDWVGWRELFGREFAPIDQIDIPPTVSLDTAIPLLADLDNLSAINLSGTSINDSQLIQLRDLRTVRSLNLSSTEITDASLPQLMTFTHLRFLYLEETDITDDGYKRLERHLPSCKITR